MQILCITDRGLGVPRVLRGPGRAGGAEGAAPGALGAGPAHPGGSGGCRGAAGPGRALGCRRAQPSPARRGALLRGLPRGRATCGRMCEGPSRISGPIPPDPGLFPEYYKRPLSARGRLEGNAQRLFLTSSPLDTVPSPCLPLGSARQAQPAPRVRPSGKDFLERGQKGTLGLLLQLQGISLDGGLPAKRKEAKDYEKENVRRIKEIQRKCKEKERAQEHSQPKPVKALWKSQKYENVESKVKAKLQETSPPPNPEAVNFLRAYSRCGSGIKPCRPLSPGPGRAKAGADTEAPEAQGAETKMQVEGRSVDFIRHNACSAKRAPLRRSQSLQALAQLLQHRQQEQEHYNARQKGHVPQYLLERKELWRKQAEERLPGTCPTPTPPLGTP
uniref:Uncharacterized protein n=1 Tax=Geospiza parvula TaxID=87175 RepID=A0A8C3MQ97_GEOPR